MLFRSMLAQDIADCDFLDLFSGSGAIGIEALSRGAKSAVFVVISVQCTISHQATLNDFLHLSDRISNFRKLAEFPFKCLTRVYFT